MTPHYTGSSTKSPAPPRSSPQTLTWTGLGTDPPSRWHHTTEPAAGAEPDLRPVAGTLLDLAATILGLGRLTSPYTLAL